jgi:uncharacterized protein involved in tolerance to divalent cations
MFVVFASLAASDEEGSRAVSVGVLTAGLAACAGAVAVIRSRHAITASISAS